MCSKEFISNVLVKLISRSSRPKVFCKEGVLRNFAKFTGKPLSQSLFFNNVAGLRPATLLKKWLWHRCFPVSFAKCLRTPFFQNTSSGCFWRVTLRYWGPDLFENVLEFVIYVIILTLTLNWRLVVWSCKWFKTVKNNVFWDIFTFNTPITVINQVIVQRFRIFLTIIWLFCLVAHVFTIKQVYKNSCKPFLYSKDVWCVARFGTICII